MKWDNYLFGILLGIAVPALGFLFLHEVNELIIIPATGTGIGLSQKFRAILSIGCNLIPFQFLLKTDYLKTIKGVVMGTILTAAFLIVWFWKEFI